MMVTSKEKCLCVYVVEPIVSISSRRLPLSRLFVCHFCAEVRRQIENMQRKETHAQRQRQDDLGDTTWRVVHTESQIFLLVSTEPSFWCPGTPTFGLGIRHRCTKSTAKGPRSGKRRKRTKEKIIGLYVLDLSPEHVRQSCSCIWIFSAGCAIRTLRAHPSHLHILSERCIVTRRCKKSSQGKVKV